MGVIDMVNGRLCETLPIEEIEQIRNESYNQALEDFAEHFKAYCRKFTTKSISDADIDWVKNKLKK